jgi:hypothetical protein
MITEAYKRFEVEAGSTPEMHYQILLRDGSGQIIDNILMKTMRDAWEEFSRRGYKSSRALPSTDQSPTEPANNKEST